MDTTREKVIYWLDPSNRIVKVNSEWDQFAQQNGGGSLMNGIIGRQLKDFIVGETSRMYVDVVLQFARVSSKPVARPYRCDSPECRRFMEMTIHPEPEGLLRIEHETTRLEPVTPPVEFEYRASSLTRRRCSICNRVERNGRWLDVADYFKELPAGVFLKGGRPVVEVVYDVCQTCSVGTNQAS